MIYPGLFKSRYSDLHGIDWIRRIDSDDRRAFVKLGLKHTEYGRLGGIARAQTGKRDKKGRFVSMNKYPEHEKLELIKNDSQTIGQFLEGLLSKYTLCEYREAVYFYDDGTGEEYDNPEGFYPVRRGIQDILAAHFGIDQDRLEDEKRQMLEEIRASNG